MKWLFEMKWNSMIFLLNNHGLFAMDDRIERMDDMKGEPPKKSRNLHI